MTRSSVASVLRPTGVVAGLALLCAVIACTETSSQQAFREQGTLLMTEQHGPFSIETRRWRASAPEGRPGRSFCNFWISYRGKDVDLSPLGYFNYYTECDGDLRLLPSIPPAILIGISGGSGRARVAALLREVDGRLVMSKVSNCDYVSWVRQPVAELPVADNKLQLCDGQLDLRTLALESDTPIHPR